MLSSVAHCPPSTRFADSASQRHPLRDSREDPPPSFCFVPSARILVDGRRGQVYGRSDLDRAKYEDAQGLPQGSKGERRGERERTRTLTRTTPQNYVAEAGAGTLSSLIDASSVLVDALIVLCTFGLSKDEANSLSMKKTFPTLYRLAPIRLIIPIQASLNVSLPSDASQMLMHKPFADRLVVFQSASNCLCIRSPSLMLCLLAEFDDVVQVMSSLQRPRKISVWGDDGNIYGFLCKQGDDLRKDSRLMEFNSFIIKLLKKDSEARKRKLGTHSLPLRQRTRRSFRCRSL